MNLRPSIMRLPSRLLRRNVSTFLLLLLCVFAAGTAFAADPPILSGSIRIHYHRPDNTYTNWTVYAFDGTTEDTGNYGGGPVAVTGTDTYGAYFDVGIATGTQEVGIILHNTSSGNKDTPNNLFVDPATQGLEYWAYSGIAKLYTSAPSLTNPTAILPGYVRVHYHRTDGNYAGWTIYAYYDTTEYGGDYNNGLVPVTNTDAYGAYFDVSVISGAQNVGLIIHNPSAAGGDQKDPGPNEFVDPTTEGFEYWAYTGIGKLYKTAPSLTNPTALLPGYARIHYYRPDVNYANWSVYAFNDTEEYTGDYNDGLTFITNTDSYGPLLRHQPHPQRPEPRLHHPQRLDRRQRSRPEHVPRRSHQHPGLGHLWQREHFHHRSHARADSQQPFGCAAGLLDGSPACRHPAAVCR